MGRHGWLWQVVHTTHTPPPSASPRTDLPPAPFPRAISTTSCVRQHLKPLGPCAGPGSRGQGRARAHSNLTAWRSHSPSASHARTPGPTRRAGRAGAFVFKPANGRRRRAGRAVWARPMGCRLSALTDRRTHTHSATRAPPCPTRAARASVGCIVRPQTPRRPASPLRARDSPGPGSDQREAPPSGPRRGKSHASLSSGEGSLPCPIMSRRSQRLTRYSQDDNDGSSSSGASSVAGSQSTLFKDSPLRTLKRKSSNMKRLSPAPQLGPSSDSHTSYYSESVVRESYIGSPRAASLARSALLDDRLHSEPYWSGDLRGRRRRGTGGSESSKANGLTTESKVSEDFFGSSSGYSSEDDFAGYMESDQHGSGSGLRSAASRAGSFVWTLVTFPGRLFGLLYWWVGTTWYRLTTAASLLDVFVLTRSRHFSLNLKTFLWFLLFLLLLTVLTYGAWYFYPFGLHTLQPTLASWWAAKESKRQPEVWESRDASPHFQAEQRILSRVYSLERRLEALAAEFSSNWQKEAIRLERLELRQGATGHGGGSGLSHEDTLTLLEGLVSRREAALKEDLRRDTMSRIQEELATLRAEHHQDSEDLFRKIVQASQESEAHVQQLKTEWQRMTQEAFQESSVKELGQLEAQLASLRQELAALTLRQNSVADEVGLLPQKIQAARADVESQFPDWVSRFLLRDKGASSGLLQRDELHAQLQELESKILASMAEMQGKSAREAAASLGQTLQKEGVVGVTEEQVHQIVKQALQRYSEDRIGMVDYALESGGASVISTRCSETYETKTALLSLFGIPLWYHSQSPRVILQPDVHPGNCWAFQGPQGFAVVRLSARIRPTAVTLEHVPKALSPNSTISSAPKDFAIFGFDEDLQQEGTLLGTFAYDQDGEPIQTFYFQTSKMATYQVVELRILTNWGHPEYTCIYRFRVHGEPAH